MSEHPPKLSRFERLLLSNQMRILEALYPQDAESIAINREAIERGYEMLYEWEIMEHINDGPSVMTREESEEVWDTLDMFSEIQNFFERNPKSELKERPFSSFRGYDGNTETKFMAFAAYTVKRLQRFESITLAKENYWNSHMPVRDVYRRMLTEWERKPRPQRMELTAADVEALLNAAIHPDSR